MKFLLNKVFFIMKDIIICLNQISIEIFEKSKPHFCWTLFNFYFCRSEKIFYDSLRCAMCPIHSAPCLKGRAPMTRIWGLPTGSHLDWYWIFLFLTDMRILDRTRLPVLQKKSIWGGKQSISFLKISLITVFQNKPAGDMGLLWRKTTIKEKECYFKNSSRSSNSFWLMSFIVIISFV